MFHLSRDIAHRCVNLHRAARAREQTLNKLIVVRFPTRISCLVELHGCSVSAIDVGDDSIDELTAVIARASEMQYFGPQRTPANPVAAFVNFATA